MQTAFSVPAWELHGGFYDGELVSDIHADTTILYVPSPIPFSPWNGNAIQVRAEGARADFRTLELAADAVVLLERSEPCDPVERYVRGPDGVFRWDGTRYLRVRV